jgi:hypothetical protein
MERETGTEPATSSLGIQLTFVNKEQMRSWRLILTIEAAVTHLQTEVWLAYSMASYASVQKSMNTLGGSGESIMRCVKSMPIIPSAGSV